MVAKSGTRVMAVYLSLDGVRRCYNVTAYDIVFNDTLILLLYAGPPSHSRTFKTASLTSLYEPIQKPSSNQRCLERQSLHGGTERIWTHERTTLQIA